MPRLVGHSKDIILQLQPKFILMRFAFISLGVILASRSTARIRLKFY